VTTYKEHKTPFSKVAAMAVAVGHGGAVAIRASGRSDIAAIREATRLPVIGIDASAPVRGPVIAGTAITRPQVITERFVSALKI